MLKNARPSKLFIAGLILIAALLALFSWRAAIVWVVGCLVAFASLLVAGILARKAARTAPERDDSPPKKGRRNARRAVGAALPISS
jgi:hypothetical protein